jgi:lipoprotein-anchoring transpeptidase ErfK/SrfK
MCHRLPTVVLPGIAAATLAIATLLGADLAAAQSAFDPQASARQRREVRRARSVPEPLRPDARARPAVRGEVVARATQPPRPQPAPKSSPPRLDLNQRAPEPLVAVISLASQSMRIYGREGVVAETRVSTGQAGFRTPTGVFSILQRNRHHRSNIYSNAPMPYMQRLTWSGIALHEGVVPNYPASHGCIRMPSGFAPRMWAIGRVGMRVIIAPDDVTAVPAAHARLPVPVMTPIETTAGVPGDAMQTASVGDDQPAARPTVLAPFALAHVRRVKAQTEQVAAEASLKEAIETAAERSLEANRAADRLRQAERQLAAAEEELEERRVVFAGAQTEAAEAELRPGLTAAATRAEAARQAFEEARKAELTHSDAAFDAAKAVKAAQRRNEEAIQAARLSASGLEPVTIFVSRREGKVFVRQGFVPLHEEPIVIANPEKPLGTHVFSAIEASGGSGLRWISVTVPSTPPPLGGPEPRRRGRDQTPAPLQSQPPPSTAATVLDRFELPPETLKLIGDRLWQGASLIVSDFGISGETGRGTDFVVLTK